ncbi:hypothetical protein ACEPAI_2953 [Sanghuangporus weigelae]
MPKRSDVLNNPAYRGCPSATLPPLKDAIIDGGRLHLKKLLGYGTWSAVYLAECTAMESYYNMDQLYAVKCMIPRRMTPWQQKAISQEVRLHRQCAAASSSILKIVKVIDDEPTGLKYIVTEYCEGGDLNDLIQQQKKENAAKDDECIRRIFLQVLDAVKACHEEGVYHRDLKPENIMLKKGKKAVLGDFGFATTNKYTRDLGMGSEPYMAPELLTRSSMPISTPHTDIWALGIILVNLITGYYPWRKATAEDRVFEWYSCNDRNFLHHNLRSISCETNEILKSIFRFRPHQRISIRELARRISRVKTFTDETDFDIDSGLVPRRQQLPVDRHLPEPAFGVLHNPRVARLKRRSEDKELPHNVLEADFSNVLPGLESGSVSDDSDSDGPETPETYAIDNAAVAHAGDVASLENISDLNLDEVPVRKPERNRFRIVRVTTKETIASDSSIFDVPAQYTRDNSGDLISKLDRDRTNILTYGANAGRRAVRVHSAIATILVSQPSDEVIAVDTARSEDGLLTIYISASGENSSLSTLSKARLHLENVWEHLSSLVDEHPQQGGDASLEPEFSSDKVIDLILHIYLHSMEKVIETFKKGDGLGVKGFITEAVDASAALLKGPFVIEVVPSQKGLFKYDLEEDSFRAVFSRDHSGVVRRFTKPNSSTIRSGSSSGSSTGKSSEGSNRSNGSSSDSDRSQLTYDKFIAHYSAKRQLRECEEAHVHCELALLAYFLTEEIEAYGFIVAKGSGRRLFHVLRTNSKVCYGWIKPILGVALDQEIEGVLAKSMENHFASIKKQFEPQEWSDSAAASGGVVKIRALAQYMESSGGKKGTCLLPGAE